MIKTLTPTSNTVINNENEKAMMAVFNESEIDFYSSIKPALEKLVIEPSTETIDYLMAFSKTI